MVKHYEGSTIILGHAIAKMSHDNCVRMVCIDTYEAVRSVLSMV